MLGRAFGVFQGLEARWPKSRSAAVISRAWSTANRPSAARPHSMSCVEPVVVLDPLRRARRAPRAGHRSATAAKRCLGHGELGSSPWPVGARNGHHVLVVDLAVRRGERRLSTINWSGLTWPDTTASPSPQLELRKSSCGFDVTGFAVNMTPETSDGNISCTTTA